MDNLLMHPSVKKHLKSLSADPPQAMLLSGESGVGLKTIAIAWAQKLSGHPTSVILYRPNEKNTIPIDTIRTLYASTRARHETIQTIIIDDADAMGIDAQNAFLKLLEEPNASTRFILTSHRPQLLLPTVRSRVIELAVPRIPIEESQQLIIQNGISDKALTAQMLFIAAGLPAELLRLIKDEAYRQAKLECAALAKQLITGTRYEILRLSGKLTTRDTAQEVVSIALRMVKAQLKNSRDEAWQKKLGILLDISDGLERNYHVRTQLLQLVV
jgi:DNA polymerase III subunit delta'